MNTVDEYLAALDHPLKPLIIKVREVISKSVPGLDENVKWNAPNFMYKGVDRITMKLYPPTKVQVVFHCGTGKKEKLPDRLISDDKGLLKWAANDRAFAEFRNEKEFEEKKKDFLHVISLWLKA